MLARQKISLLQTQQAKNMADVQPCFFPILDGSANPVTIWRSTSVSLHDAVDLRCFCERLDVSPLSVLQMAWAVVLRCYVGSNLLSFGCIGLEKLEYGRNVNAGFDEASHLNPFCAELEDECTVLKNLKSIAGHTVTCL